MIKLISNNDDRGRWLYYIEKLQFTLPVKKTYTRKYSVIMPKIESIRKGIYNSHKLMSCRLLVSYCIFLLSLFKRSHKTGQRRQRLSLDQIVVKGIFASGLVKMSARWSEDGTNWVSRAPIATCTCTNIKLNVLCSSV